MAYARAESFQPLPQVLMLRISLRRALAEGQSFQATGKASPATAGKVHRPIVRSLRRRAAEGKT
jgi:hypothetical protein